MNFSSPVLIDLLMTYHLNRDPSTKCNPHQLLSERVGEWGFSVDFKN